MKRIMPITAALLGLFAACTAASAFEAQVVGAAFDNRLMPQPAALKLTGTEFVLPHDFSIRFDSPPDLRLKSAVNRSLARLHAKIGCDLRLLNLSDSTTPSLTVAVHSPNADIQTVDEDEAYHLTVTATGISLTARTDVGAIHGVQTLLQLVQSSQGHFVVPGVEIDDSPRFRWRGLLVDCSRHFEPVAEIKRTLDAMEAVKLNVFHWHLTDDQGFRVESKVFPKLTEVGSDGLF